MKKLYILPAMFLLALTLTACGEEKPEDALSGAMSDMSKKLSDM